MRYNKLYLWHYVLLTMFFLQVLTDLSDRLARSTRMVPALEGVGFEYGFHGIYNQSDSECGFINSLN